MSNLPSDWRELPAAQQPEWRDPAALQRVLGEIRQLPSLVTIPEVRRLRKALISAEQGHRFVLQGGDCAETFAECTSERLKSQLKILLQMSLILVHGREQGIVRVGRIGGQYAKPRSAPTETREGVTLPSYRGDNVNSPEFTQAARQPDPQRLLRGHLLAGMTMNHLRGLIDGGFADLHHPDYWEFPWMEHSPQAEEYRRRVRGVRDAVRFVERLAPTNRNGLDRVDLYSSHEALLLEYENAQRVGDGVKEWLLSTHLPWIGVRTADPGGAHVGFFARIANPVGVKVGPETEPERLLELCKRLNPDNESGKLILIHRFGADRIAEHLPPLLDTVRSHNRRALWICDPMHGNTESTPNGYKTRPFARVQQELLQAFRIHREHGGQLGGVHLELTGDNVTECTGGARELTSADLEHRYVSQVDPRLNAEQALELALSMVDA